MHVSKLLIVSGAILLSCGKNPAIVTNSSPNENPSWVNAKTQQYSIEPITSPPRSIYQYEYNGKKVYFVPAICCDERSILFDENGNQVCSPDGGLSGSGDGKCPDFFDTRTNEKLIWKDVRDK